MARKGLDVTGMKKWQRWLSDLEHKEVEHTKGRILRTSGLRALEHLDDLTPVRSGRLKGSMSFGDQHNVFTLKAGSRAFVFVGTAVEYAQHVNDGFTQKAGQFVPGYWKSGDFVYDPASSKGMVLTGKVIPGAHMFEKAMDELENDLPKILEYEFRRLYNKLF